MIPPKGSVSCSCAFPFRETPNDLLEISYKDAVAISATSVGFALGDELCFELRSSNYHLLNSTPRFGNLFRLVTFAKADSSSRESDR